MYLSQPGKTRGYGLVATMIAIAVSASAVALVIGYSSAPASEAVAQSIAKDVRHLSVSVQAEFNGDYSALNEYTPGRHAWFPPHYFQADGTGPVLVHPSTLGPMFALPWTLLAGSPALPGMDGSEGFGVVVRGLDANLCQRLVPLLATDFDELWIGPRKAKSLGGRVSGPATVSRLCAEDSDVMVTTF